MVSWCWELPDEDWGGFAEVCRPEVGCCTSLVLEPEMLLLVHGLPWSMLRWLPFVNPLFVDPALVVCRVVLESENSVERLVDCERLCSAPRPLLRSSLRRCNVSSSFCFSSCQFFWGKFDSWHQYSTTGVFAKTNCYLKVTVENASWEYFKSVMFLFKHCPVILDSGGMLTWLCLFVSVCLSWPTMFSCHAILMSFLGPWCSMGTCSSLLSMCHSSSSRCLSSFSYSSYIAKTTLITATADLKKWKECKEIVEEPFQVLCLHLQLTIVFVWD